MGRCQGNRGAEVPALMRVDDVGRMMFRKKKINIDEMTAAELRELHDKFMRRVLWENGLWLLFVVAMLFIWQPAGIVLVILTALKYTYDYFDTDSQAINAGIIATIFKKEVEERRDEE